MTAKKKNKDTIPTTRYRRRDQIVDAIEGAAVLEHTGEEYPFGVTSAPEGGGLLFLGMLITASSFLVYDELGAPLELLNDLAFKELYDLDAGAKANDALHRWQKFEDQVLEQDKTIDGLRADRQHLKTLIESLAAGLGLKIETFESEDAFVAAVTAKKTGDNATQVLRDILKIEPAQVRDDGGRIIHLNKKIIDRAVTVI